MTAPIPPDPGYAARVRRYVAEQRYLRLLGVVLARLEPGLVEYRLPFRPDLGQQDGFFHGGVVGGIAEAVMGAAAATLVAEGVNVVGAQYGVNLLAPAQGPVLLARGQVVKPGRRLIVCRADVFSVEADGSERLCAIAQGAMAPVA
jgi:uncharacterized protein (TIGR00369 family)